jgi:molecular chaperone GrpE (heat shock protein)
MQAELRGIRAAFDQLLAREELLEQLHRRLASFEQDERIRSVIEPLARRIAPSMRRLDEQIHLLRNQEARNRPSSMEQRVMSWFRSCLDALRLDLENVLNDFGIDTFVGRSEKFDRTSQEIVKRVPVLESSTIGKVAQRLAPGFRCGQRILIPERVAVYVAHERLPDSHSQTRKNEP